MTDTNLTDLSDDELRSLILEELMEWRKKVLEPTQEYRDIVRQASQTERLVVVLLISGFDDLIAKIVKADHDELWWFEMMFSVRGKRK